MEKIKMYELKWTGRTDRSAAEITEILREIVKTCVDSNACGYDAWSVTSNAIGEIFVKIVTIIKDVATDSRYPPSLLRIKNASGESGERTLSNSAGF